MVTSEITMRRYIDLEALYSSYLCPPILRRITKTLMQTTYLTVGRFLAELSQEDLNELVTRANNVTESKPSANTDFEFICLLGEILSQAEGAPDQDLEYIAANTMILLKLEDMSRKGHFEFYHGRATLSGNLAELNLGNKKSG